MSELTKDDLRDVRDTLSEQLRDGFAGAHSRLDALNGRMGKSEVAIGQHHVRLANVEHQVFQRRRGDPDDADPGDGGAAAHMIAERDVRLVLGTLAAATAVIGFFWKILPILHRVVTP